LWGRLTESQGGGEGKLRADSVNRDTINDQSSQPQSRVIEAGPNSRSLEIRLPLERDKTLTLDCPLRKRN
jgi:hypothetical protein